MTVLDQAPLQSLQRCLDAVLSDMQAHCLLAPHHIRNDRQDEAWADVWHDKRLAALFVQLEAASRFLLNKSAIRRCQALCRYWRVQHKKTSIGLHRQRVILKGLLRGRESMQAVTPDRVLRHLIADQISAAVDSLATLPGHSRAEQAWLRQTLARGTAINHAARFLADGSAGDFCPPPETLRELLGWLFALNRRVRSNDTDMFIPATFTREINRCIERLCVSNTALVAVRGAHTGLSPVLNQSLWQLQLLASAVLALSSMIQHRSVRCFFAQHCQGVIWASARALFLRRHFACAGSGSIRQVLRHALAVSFGTICEPASGTKRSDQGGGMVTDVYAPFFSDVSWVPDVADALAPLPASDTEAVGELLAVIAHSNGAQISWPDVSQSARHCCAL